MKWLNRFWDEHGNRLVFMTLAATGATALYHLVDMKPEAQTVWLGLVMLLYNKCRSVVTKKKEPEGPGNK